jgi:hypothetical protein
VIKKIVYIFKRFPFHLFLLPVFFILHTWLQFAGLLETPIVLISMLKIFVGMGLFFALLYFILRHNSKAAILTTFFAVLFLYFGNIKTGMEHIPGLKTLSHYKILLPLIVAGSAIAIYITKKARSVVRLTAFLNLLFLVYIVIDGIRWMKMVSQKSLAQAEIPGEENGKGIPGQSFPSIYYIVFDCYPSPLYQQEILGRKNKVLDSFLMAKGFYVVADPSSNYNSTAFSISSTLQMDYDRWLKPGKSLHPLDYTLAIQKVKNSPVIKLLQQNGYRLYNLSIFDFPGNPSIKPERFLSTTTRQAIFYNTLWNCLRRDVFRNTETNNTTADIQKDRKAVLGSIENINQRLLDSLSGLPAQLPGSSPAFVYAHIGMPHFPYFYDSTGHLYPDELIYGDSMITSRERFRNYIAYTDKKIMSLVDTLFKQKRKDDVFIIQSDHGIADLDWSRQKDAFRNYAAFYFPGGDYQSLYPGMSNVNTFRIILNKYLGQRLPLLTDSSHFVK